jgi:hypothetical protein
MDNTVQCVKCKCLECNPDKKVKTPDELNIEWINNVKENIFYFSVNAGIVAGLVGILMACWFSLTCDTVQCVLDRADDFFWRMYNDGHGVVIHEAGMSLFLLVVAYFGAGAVVFIMMMTVCTLVFYCYLRSSKLIQRLQRPCCCPVLDNEAFEDNKQQSEYTKMEDSLNTFVAQQPKQPTVKFTIPSPPQLQRVSPRHVFPPYYFPQSTATVPAEFHAHRRLEYENATSASLFTDKKTLDVIDGISKV